jgi:hypothetical protein
MSGLARGVSASRGLPGLEPGYLFVEEFPRHPCGDSLVSTRTDGGIEEQRRAHPFFDPLRVLAGSFRRQGVIVECDEVRLGTGVDGYHPDWDGSGSPGGVDSLSDFHWRPSVL